MTQERPSGGRQRLNVLGLLNRANEAYCYPLPSSLSSAEVLAALDHCASACPHRLTLVILDHAPIHPSAAVTSCCERWLAKGGRCISCRRTAPS